MMRLLHTRAAFACVAALIGVSAAQAQIRPYHADDPSFNAPQMRRHGSGFYRPNRPHGHPPLHPFHHLHREDLSPRG